MSLADKVRETRKAKKAELDTVLSTETPDEARASQLIEDIKSADVRISDLDAIEAREAATAADDASTGNVGRTERAAEKVAYGKAGQVIREERTYTLHKDITGEVSYFSDAHRAQSGNVAATERLTRHMREVEAEGELSQRATTTASFAGAIVPQYLVDLAALAARNGRPVANAVTRLPLPDQGMNLIIPRGTTGASVTAQATENASVSSTDEVWANLTVPVVTAAGQQDVSRQALERGMAGLDALIYRDLAGAYAAELDRQVITGSGAAGQALGIYNTAGVNQATAYTAAASATTFWLKLAGAVNSIESSGTVVAPANLVICHPRRFSWLLGQVDSQGRPLITPVSPAVNTLSTFGQDVNAGAYSGNPQTGGTGVDFNSYTVKGYLQGLPVITDANVPTAVGTGPEDLLFVVNTDHMLLWEIGDGMPNQLRFEQTLGNQLTVKLVAYNYFAFTAGRYPTAASVVGGNAGTIGFGQVAPTF